MDIFSPLVKEISGSFRIRLCIYDQYLTFVHSVESMKRIMCSRSPVTFRRMKKMVLAPGLLPWTATVTSTQFHLRAPGVSVASQPANHRTFTVITFTVALHIMASHVCLCWIYGRVCETSFVTDGCVCFHFSCMDRFDKMMYYCGWTILIWSAELLDFPIVASLCNNILECRSGGLGFSKSSSFQTEPSYVVGLHSISR